MSGTPPRPPDSAAAGAPGSQAPVKVEPAAQRRPASAVPSISGLVLSPYGGRATLVDISVSGLLAECGVALKVGQAVKVTFEGTFTPHLVEARVVRSSVASMTAGGFRYHVGVAFKTPIAFADDPPPATGAGDARPAVAAAAPPPPASRADSRSPTVATDPPPSRVVNRW